jgi:nicotinate phosphoribosyltransferase
MAKGIKITSGPEDLETVRRRVTDGLSNMWEEEKRFYNPHIHYMDMSPEMYQLKQNMLHMHGVKEVK